MIRCWLALTYYLYALRLAALSHFYFNPLYKKPIGVLPIGFCFSGSLKSGGGECGGFFGKAGNGCPVALLLCGCGCKPRAAHAQYIG